MDMKGLHIGIDLQSPIFYWDFGYIIAIYWLKISAFKRAERDWGFFDVILVLIDVSARADVFAFVNEFRESFCFCNDCHFFFVCFFSELDQNGKLFLKFKMFF